VPAAIDLALDAFDAHEAARAATSRPDDLVLLLHDDLELGPTPSPAGRRARGRRAVAIVGPKLRWADDPDRLQSVGATIDLTGRVDDGIDPDELDQGQRDGDRRVLFVPTAGMLVRRRVFDALGRFDRRAMPSARTSTSAGARRSPVTTSRSSPPRWACTPGCRPSTSGGRVAELGPRYLAERNTLAALLRNYGPERLVVVLPLALLVGVGEGRRLPPHASAR
jgi:hypothetical protein